MMNIKKHDLPTNKIDYEQFEYYLQKETWLLKDWFVNKYFVEEGVEAGSEIEFFMLDKNFAPDLKNLAFINKVNNPSLVSECGAAQLEINSSHHPMTGDCLTKLHQNILNTWHVCCEEAAKNQNQLILIGALPTSNNLHSQPTYITNEKRYLLMNEQIENLRKNEQFLIKLAGKDELVLRQPNSMCVGGLLSALQLHLKTPFSQSVQFYNTIQIVSAPMLALCANSPFFDGKDLWSESRIGLFEQLFNVDKKLTQHKPVDYFGNKYLTQSFFELFTRNLSHYPRLIIETSPNADIDLMFHVRRQNGIIHRWNRPVIDFCNRKPHLRIEHRCPSTGPTIVDMIANAAFFYGTVNYFANQSQSIEHLLSFKNAKWNFYQAARFGLDARFNWFKNREIIAWDLINELIPLAHIGLSQLQITENDIDYYLNIIKQRIIFRQNGTIWQRAFINKYGKDFTNMLKVYMQNQNNEIPVSKWKF